METDRLKYFCTIVETGSLSKAAELLGISHSGLSKAMAVLQSELNIQLFKPVGRGLEVTPFGKDVYNRSKDLLLQVDRLRESDKKIYPSVRIGIQEIFSYVLTGAFAERLGKGVDFFELDSGELEIHIIEKKIDFAFTFVPFPHKDLEYLKIAKMSFGSFCRRGAFSDLDSSLVPYVVPTSELKDNPLSLKIRDGWSPELARNISYRANCLSAALSIATSGAAAIYISKTLARLMNSSLTKECQLVDLPMSIARRNSETTSRDVYLVKNKSEDETAEMKKCSQVIRATCRQG